MHSQRPRLQAILALMLSMSALAAPAAFAQDTQAGEVLAPVEIKSKRNQGDLPYKGFLSQQSDLLSYMPPEPRAIDMRLRVSFTAMNEAERDIYLPATWAVAIVGDTVDHQVEMSRGGYFTLPYIEQAARERATIMFNTQTRKGWVDVAWLVRAKEDNTLAYADFARALEQVRYTQDKMPWYRTSFRYEKKVRFNALKACFTSGEGDILVDGHSPSLLTRGPCKILRFEPELASAGAGIALLGTVANITLDAID